MVYAIVAVIVLLLDQAVKYLTITGIPFETTQAFIPGFMELTNIHNTKMAFGLGIDSPIARWVMVALTFVFVIVLIVLLYKNVVKGKLGRWMLILVMAGGLGNCIDRIINGYVVDMFHFDFKIFGYDFPVFNVADIFITVAGIIFCFWLVFHKDEPEQVKAPAKPAPRRAMPPATGRPQRGPDYLTQLQKPVVQAKVNLENDELARQQAAEMRAAQQQQRSNQQRAARYPKGEVFDWSNPEFPDAPKADQAKPAAFDDPFAEFMKPQAKPVPRQQSAPRPQSSVPAPFPAPKSTTSAENAPAPAPKKSDGDFSLEDILAEFKD